MPARRSRGLQGLLGAAVETTVSALRTRRPAEETFCLCHGTSGNAEILLEVERLTQGTARDPSTAPRDVALEAADDGVRRFHESGTWPCGLKGAGESPGLLLGLAGIGHFYLRLHDPEQPSPLQL